MPMPSLTTYMKPWGDPTKRFWSYVDVRGPDECWPWKGAIPAKGYPHMNYFGKRVTVSRLSYTLANGNFDPAKFVLHRCDNPLCVNPRHLFLGTAKDNTQDCIAKGRQNYAVGERARSAVLTAPQVTQIREQAAQGVPQRTLAKQFSVGEGQISRIVHRHTWQHI